MRSMSFIPLPNWTEKSLKPPSYTRQADSNDPVDFSGEIFLIGAAEIDCEHVLRQIRSNAATRTPLSHAAAVLGRARMEKERLALLETLKELKSTMRDYGMVASRRRSWLGRFELLIKRGIRKLFLRHILQQHRVHLKLTKFLGQVIDYFADQDHAFRACLDHPEQRQQEAVPSSVAGAEIKAYSSCDENPPSNWISHHASK